MARLVALKWSRSKAKVPVEEAHAPNQTSLEFEYEPQGGRATPNVPIAPTVEPFNVLHVGAKAGNKVAPATAGQLGKFGLHNAGVEEQGSSPGPGQDPTEHWICIRATSGPIVPQPGCLCTRMKYVADTTGVKVNEA